jgi:hypothetical protein
MSDPREAAASLAGSRAPQLLRVAGWSLSVLFWALASDGRLLLALASLLVAALIRCAYVVLIAAGRSVFWSPWFFAVAGVVEIAWLTGTSSRF